MVFSVPWIEPKPSLQRRASRLGKDLFGEGVHAAAGLAGTDRSGDGDTGVKSLLRNGEPKWLVRRFRTLGMMQFPDHQEEPVSFMHRRVYWQRRKHRCFASRTKKNNKRSSSRARNRGREQ